MKNLSSSKIDRPTDASAEVLAIAILTWLSAEPSMMSRFLAISGIDPAHIRGMIGEAGFYGGLTGFLMNHEPTLLQFCHDNEIKVEWVQACHQHFSGPDDGAWL